MFSKAGQTTFYCYVSIRDAVNLCLGTHYLLFFCGFTNQMLLWHSIVASGLYFPSLYCGDFCVVISFIVFSVRHRKPSLVLEGFAKIFLNN